jgi:hypothetical protein
MSSKILPPDRKSIKRPEGSFFKRNWWKFIVVFAIMGIGAGVWYVYRTVKADERRYASLVQDTTVTDSVVKVDTGVVAGKLFDEPYDKRLKYGTLNIDLGATVLILRDTTGKMITAQTDGLVEGYKFKTEYDNETFKGTLNYDELKEAKKWRGKDDEDDDTVSIKLNNNPVWDMNLKAGASDVDFDLSKFKVRSLKLNGGAVEFKIKMGEPLDETRIICETGMADIDFAIPAKAACQIKSSSGFSSNKFDGFKQTSKGIYETPGFADAKNKLYLEFNGAVSDFKVHKY